MFTTNISFSAITTYLTTTNSHSQHRYTFQISLSHQMIFRFFNSLSDSLSSLTYPLMLYAVAWTSILTATVAVASFTPEWAFVSAISPSSPLSQACHVQGSVRLPLDMPSEDFCLAARLFQRSRIDMFVPPLFAAIIVAGSACAVRALGLWETDDEQPPL